VREPKRQLFLNSTVSIVQTIGLGIVPFILYRYVLETIGAEQFGLWAIVLSTTSLARVAEFGLSASIVKFVAKYIARDERFTAGELIQTAAITTFFGLGLLLLLVYPIASYFLYLIVPGNYIELGRAILPLALISYFITTVAAIFQSGLDGSHRIDLRSIVMVLSALFYLFLAMLLTSVYGLWGLAYAQILQALVAAILSWFLLRRFCLSSLPIIPYRWQFSLLREMVTYGLNFQAISLAQMFYKPVTVALISRFGGLSLVAYYEMADKMLRQFRSLVVSASQAIVPFIADLHERSPAQVTSFYKASYSLLLYIATPLFGGVVALVPLISRLWIGTYEDTFVRFSYLLAIGWYINLLSVPAFFAGLGLGELRWNTVSSIAMALLNATLGYFLGSLLGADAVVLAWVASLAAGSVLVLIPYHREHQISFKNLLPSSSAAVLISNLVAITCSLLVYYSLLSSTSALVGTASVMTIYASIVLVPMWVHPLRSRLSNWLRLLFLSRRPRIEADANV
jgi:O-antigen/teichoic acid export membrane protein